MTPIVTQKGVSSAHSVYRTNRGIHQYIQRGETLASFLFPHEVFASRRKNFTFERLSTIDQRDYSLGQILHIIAIVAIIGFILYLITKIIVENVKRYRIRKSNRKAQYSGRAVDEKRGLWYYITKSRSDYIGDFGEFRVSSFLADLPREEYKVYNDLLIRNGGYTTQIDHIVISRYGVFVLETKNIHGKVYGSGKAEFWKQYLPDIGYKRYGFTQEHQIRNPIWQNAGHIKTLRRLVFGNDIPIYGLVIFPDETELYVTAEQPVLAMRSVVPYIDGFQDVVLSSDQIGYFGNRLLEIVSTSISDRKQHIENVYKNQERRNVAVASRICPLCGGKLVLRKGKYGQFYGCSNYPKCNYTIQY